MQGFLRRPLINRFAVESSIQCSTQASNRDSLWVILSLLVRSIQGDSSIFTIGVPFWWSYYAKEEPSFESA